MADPTPSQYFDVAKWTYTQGQPYPSELTPFYLRNGQFDILDNSTGLYGAAFKSQGTDPYIIVGFEGTNLGHFSDQPEFVTSQIAADFDIYEGRIPPAFTEALNFARAVIAEASNQGIATDRIFLSGHSLGAAEAEYVAAQLGLSGTTYGAPGIISSAVPDPGGSLLTNNAEYGDPVANYSFTPLPYESFFLQSDQIQRYGSAQFIGPADDPTAGRAILIGAGLAFAPGMSAEAKAAGLVALAGAAAEFHLLDRYQTDLGITSSIPTPEWMQTLTAGDIISVYADAVEDPSVTALLGSDALANNLPQFGSSDHEVMTGTSETDEMHGGLGNDLIHGFDNNDSLYGDSGNDTVFGDAGNDLLIGGGGNDELRGFLGNDTLFGEYGNDSLFGEQDNDLIDGGRGDDFASGGSGNDEVRGAAGNDHLFGDEGDDRVDGGEGDDQVRGWFGNDTLFGSEGNDQVFGEEDDDFLGAGSGNDYLSGGLGTDSLYGEDGNDLLFGNAGNDELVGGAGSDTFGFGRGDGQDLIRDFVTGGPERDVIAFNGGVFTSFAAVQAASQQVGADVVITYGAGDTIRLQNVQASSLTAANFTFS
ncbi:hypothetical protein [Methylobacterium nodulans]|uniref:hypothetical protein n=1 Tax=Methylobacterium nodulans TaxID=114616 RepID=UPI001FCB6FF8|nr:hypothetical protein [Methylobacterium nodulans]